MTEKITKVAAWSATLGYFGFQVAPFALAATTFTGSLPPVSISNVSGFANLLCTIAGWLFVFLIILSVIFIILAAFNYLTASGDPEKVKTASHQLIYAVVAIVVAVLARAIPLIVATFVGSNLGGA